MKICIYTGKEQVDCIIFLNRLLHGVLDHTPTIILVIFFYKVNIFILLDKLCQKIIPQFIIG